MLDEQVEQFQAEVERLAFAAARAIIAEELAHRRAEAEPGRARKGRPAAPARPTRKQLELGFGRAPKRQLDLPLAQRMAAEAAPPTAPPDETRREAAAAAAPDAAAAPAPASPERSPDAPGDAPGGAPAGRGRTRWTRETITSELATWLLSGTAIDAQFMTRHGPKGLVAAIRRVFGRFEAALNVAALHNAKLYPEGPPTRGSGPGRPPAIAAPPPESK